MKLILIISLCWGLISHASQLKLDVVAQGLVIPWGMVFLDAERMLVTERTGTFKVVNVKTKSVVPVKGQVAVYSSGQGGLLDVALDPEFSKNNKIYFTYAKIVQKNQTTALASAELIENKDKSFELKNIQDLFLAQPAVDSSIHFGSRVAVTANEIWMTVGDRNKRDLAQDLSTHMGKVLRLDKNGKAHSSNPFIKNKSAKPEIWSYGHRNPQGLVWIDNKSELWIHEHGPRGGDELNLVEKGANYGWPIVSHGREYWGPSIGEGKEKAGIIKSVHVYTPSIAPCGLVYYTSDVIPEFKDSFLIGALKLLHLNQVKLKEGKFFQEKRHFENQDLRIRDVEVGPDGLVYFSTDSGLIYQVRSI